MGEFARIVAAFFSTSVFAGLIGMGLAAASRKLKVEQDEQEEAVNAALPGLNCGACGYAGCASYAAALISGEDTDASRCTPGGPDTLKGLSELLNLTPDAAAEQQKAALACCGTKSVKEFRYRGYADCESLYLHFRGDKGCKYSCLGLGSCVKSCPVDAISYTADGLVRVDRDRCTGCEICTAVCPTGAMVMVPERAEWFVACRSRDKAKITKSHCPSGCIGCRICERKFPDAGFSVTDNLSVLNYNKAGSDACKAASGACPTHCIIRIKD